VFKNALGFNSDISQWIVRKVTNMKNMFYRATSFNRDLPWNAGEVTTMESMFELATQFNGDISLFNVIKVVNMENIFKDAKSFAQGTWCSASWKVSPFSGTTMHTACVVKAGGTNAGCAAAVGSVASAATCAAVSGQDIAANVCEFTTSRVFCCPIGKYVKASTDVAFPKNDCTRCPAGKVQGTESLVSACTDCPRDSIAPAVGLSVCAGCTSNTCIVKKDGSNADCVAGARDAAACAAATVSGNNGNAANDCVFTMSSSNFYQEDSSFDKLLISSPFSSVDRTSCEKCGPGFWMDISGANTECKGCGLGKFSAFSVQISCLDCPKGYHQHELESPFCLPCTPGTINSEVGQENCKVCGTGTYMPLAASEDSLCTDCISGQYRPGVGGTSCESCPPGTYSTVVGSDALSKCGTLRCSLRFVLFYIRTFGLTLFFPFFSFFFLFSFLIYLINLLYINR